MGVAATTIYDVQTRYRMVDDASPALRKYDAATNKAERSTRRFRTQLRGSAHGLRMIGIVAGGGIAGIAGIGVVTLGISKTFRNLNTELNATINLASQVNLAAQFSADPVQNFNASLRASRGLMQDLTKDAARLPGELRDFIVIAQQASGGVFAGGGNLERLRQMTGRLALVTPAAGGDPQATARQAMRILFGTASIGDSTLLAMMMPILRTLGVRDTTQLNAMTAARRLTVFDDALSKLTDNPMFRESVMRTWDTQLGTLADLLTGPKGIGGQLLSGTFTSALDALTEFNTVLDQRVSGIVEGIHQIGDVINEFGALITAWANSGPVRAVSYLVGGGLARDLGLDATSKMPGGYEIALGTLAGLRIFSGQAGSRTAAEEYARLQSGLEAKSFVRSNLAFQADQTKLVGQLGIGPDAHKFTPRSPSAPEIIQNFTIKVDLKSDDSPEAIAVKVGKGMEKLGQMPRTWGRAVPATTRRGVLGP